MPSKEYIAKLISSIDEYLYKTHTGGSSDVQAIEARQALEAVRSTLVYLSQREKKNNEKEK